jgi:hypothetical protein
MVTVDNTINLAELTQAIEWVDAAQRQASELVRTTDSSEFAQARRLLDHLVEAAGALHRAARLMEDRDV